MYLSNEEIKELVKEKGLISDNFVESNLTPNGYDMTIGSMTFDRRFIYIETAEEFSIPNDVVGTIFLRSTFARMGLVGTFGAVDAGYKGKLSLTLLNSDGLLSCNYISRVSKTHGATGATVETTTKEGYCKKGDMVLQKGTRIAQILFSKMSKETSAPYNGKYQKKTATQEQ